VWLVSFLDVTPHKAIPDAVISIKLSNPKLNNDVELLSSPK
jgi:hypothetical protein